jgi:hypothetical protein
MKERILTKEEQILVLETQIKERALIIYVLESALLDEEDNWSADYKGAIKDEIENHKLILSEYQELLKQFENA